MAKTLDGKPMKNGTICKIFRSSPPELQRFAHRVFARSCRFECHHTRLHGAARCRFCPIQGLTVPRFNEPGGSAQRIRPRPTRNYLFFLMSSAAELVRCIIEVTKRSLSSK